MTHCKLAGLALVAALGMAPALPVAAQDVDAKVAVPDAPNGARLSGCYEVKQRLYGPYRMTFCL